MKPFSFIHAADLHLDSPFSGVTAESPAIADALRNSTFDAFYALINACLDRNVEFLLVAGDVYDGMDRSLRAQLRFRDGLAKLAERGIESFVVHGNHDPLDGRSNAISWPAGVHIFAKNTVESVELDVDGTTVASLSGISHPRKGEQRNLSKLFPRESSVDGFRIGLLHSNVGTDTGHEPYAPCALSDLVDVGMHYWALGHVHTMQVLHDAPCVVYPGNIQGRSIRETGPRGCYHVQVDANGTVTLDFIPLDVIRWEYGSASIDGLNDIDGLLVNIESEVHSLQKKADGRPVVCRIALGGRGPLYRELRQEGAMQDLLDRVRETVESESPFAWVQEIVVECRPNVDLDKRRETPDLLGEMLRIVQELRGDEDGNERVISDAISTLYRNRRVKRALDLPSGENVQELLSSAELLALDLLEDTS